MWKDLGVYQDGGRVSFHCLLHRCLSTCLSTCCAQVQVISESEKPFVSTSLLLNPAHSRCLSGNPKLDLLSYSGSEPAFRAAPHAKGTQTPGSMQSAQLKFNAAETGGLFFLMFLFYFSKEACPKYCTENAYDKATIHYLSQIIIKVLLQCFVY